MRLHTIKLLAVLAMGILLGQCAPTTSVQQPSIPEWAKNSVIYEVNIRQYTPEGTFAAFENHLPRLKEMGVDILWIMPIHPIGELNRKGSLGSYYSIRDYKAVNPEFGSFDDFKRLVQKAHELNMKVIIDWVANHTSWDHAWTNDHADYYEKDSLGQMFGPFDWSDVAQLDYKNPGLRAAMTDALTFWVREANIDGYRCDVAGMVPVDFWENARAEIEKIKPVFMLAEDEENPTLLNKAFNANYGWSFHHHLNKVANGEENASVIAQWVAMADTTFAPGTFAMQFTSNHDENSWNGTEYERLGNAVKTYAALTFVVPGMPLIYTGQEASLNKRLAFFEKDSIDWSNLEMASFYKQLTELKKSNTALANGDWGGKYVPIETDQPYTIVAFERKKDKNHVVSIFNLSADTVSVKLPLHIYGTYINHFSKKSSKLDSTSLKMAPLEFLILTK
jgi:glycosidase